MIRHVVLAVAFVTLLGVGATMAQSVTPAGSGAEPLILDAKPPTTGLVELDITSRQQALGTQKIIDVQEGQIVLPGEPLVYVLHPQSNPLVWKGEIPLSKPGQRYYLIRFYFTLNLLNGRRVKQLTFRGRLDTADAVAWELLPPTVTTPEEVKTSMDLAFSISASPAGEVAKAGADANWTRSVAFTRLTPVIIAKGGGRPDFSWVFRGVGDNPVDEGARAVATVVSVPPEAKELKVSFAWDVELERRFPNDLFRFRDVPVWVQEQTRDLPLQ